MRKIEKGPEPKAWRKYRETPGVRVEFHSIPELVQALLREQGYICAYCTCRVTEASNSESGRTSTESASISRPAI